MKNEFCLCKVWNKMLYAKLADSCDSCSLRFKCWTQSNTAVFIVQPEDLVGKDIKLTNTGKVIKKTSLKQIKRILSGEWLAFEYNYSRSALRKRITKRGANEFNNYNR